MNRQNTLIPDSMRRTIEQAIHQAVNPTGMSVHDGMVRLPVDYVQRLLTLALKYEQEISNNK